MSGNTIKTWSVGDILTAADQNSHPVQQQWVVKPSNETVTSSTTLQNDDHLFMSVAASTRYLVECLLIIKGSVNVGDVKLAWTAPASSTFDWAPWGPKATATSPLDAIDAQYRTISENIGVVAKSTTVLTFARPVGVLLTGSAGTFQFQWAPSNSTADAAVVQAGSLMRLTRLAA